MSDNFAIPNSTNHKLVLIHINTVDFHVPPGHISYEELARLEYPQDDPNDLAIIYTESVEYPDGHVVTLARGDKPVHVKEGMACNVRKSGRS